MENTVELMLKDHIIDKEALLMRKHDLIGMTKEQAMLVLNVISLEKNGSKITMNSIQRNFSYTKSDLERLLGELMAQGLVKIRISKTGLNFNTKDL